MKNYLIFINALFTCALGMVIPVCIAFAIEGKSCIQEWVSYATLMLIIECAVWILAGTVALVRRLYGRKQYYRYIRGGRR